MNGRTMTGVLIGLAFPLAFVGSAAADFADDVRESISVPSAGDVRDSIEIPSFDDDDGDDEGSFDPPSHDDFSGVDDEARDRASQIRDEILHGSDD